MHHAYVVSGSLSSMLELEKSARKLFKFKEGDPDVHIYVWEKVGIEEAKELTRVARLTSISDRALFIIGVGSMTFESQQALLKLFEEPSEGVVFVLLVPHGALIPTLRSRFIAYPEDIAPHTPHLDVKKFIKSPYKERSAYIAALLKDEEGVKERVREFVHALEADFATKVKKNEAREALEDIALVRRYLGDRSSSLKMLLEHLAIALPNT